MKHKTLFFSVAVILLVFTAIDIYYMTHPREFHYGAVVSAEELSAKPVDYFVLMDPEPYVLEALSHPGTDVFAGTWDNLNKINELIMTYDTNNAEYGDAYYTVQLYSVDPVFMGLFWIPFFGWIVLAISFAITTLRHGPENNRTKKVTSLFRLTLEVG